MSPLFLAMLTGASIVGIGYLLSQPRPISLKLPSFPGTSPSPPASMGSVIAFGDSLTAGRNSYADILGADKVARVGASSAWVRQNALERLASATYDTVIVLAGVNDGNGRSTISNLRDIYSAARAQGARVVAVTELPWRGYPSWSAAAQARQDDTNRWILSGGDGLVFAAVDAYSALSDPTRPGYLAPQYDSGDGLHLNAAGQRRLAQVVRQRVHS